MKINLEDQLRLLGATRAEIRFGDEAYITIDNLQGEVEGWDVVDDRRRYPRVAGASLSVEVAARFAKQMRGQPEQATFSSWSAQPKGADSEPK